MKIKVAFDAKKILASRGLGASKEVQKELASTVVRLSDKYVPMSSGSGAHMKDQAKIASDGSSIVYPGPYAHYQWYGEVYGPNYTNGERFWSGNAPKKPTGRKLTYNGAPMRGARWTERMMIDRKEDVEKSVEAFIKRG